MTSIQAGTTQSSRPIQPTDTGASPLRGHLQTTTTGSRPKDKLLELVEPRSQCAGQLRCALPRLRASRAHRADGSGRRAATTAYSTSPPQAHFHSKSEPRRSRVWVVARVRAWRLGAVPRTGTQGPRNRHQIRSSLTLSCLRRAMTNVVSPPRRTRVRERWEQEKAHASRGASVSRGVRYTAPRLERSASRAVRVSSSMAIVSAQDLSDTVARVRVRSEQD